MVIVSKGDFMRTGYAFSDFGREYNYEPIYKEYGASRHLTFVFNVFVWM